MTEGAVAPSDPLLAKLEKALGAQFEILRLLGRGGMGAVYLAREHSLDRLVAIKVLLPEAANAESDERFRREARTAAKLTHPNIVPLHTFGEAEGMMYFVMGFVQGESLKEMIDRKGKIEPDDARRILGEVAGALHYAHKQGVVHRDIKPDNILIADEDGSPLLTDFGIAQSVASGETLTQMGTTLGTPHYMSPEQASGERDIDGRSDLYSLGIVGYQMLSGKLPFEGDSLRDVLVQQVTKEPTPLDVLSPSTPNALAEAIAGCLRKDPDDRISDGAGLQSALGFGIATDPDDEGLPDYVERVVGEWRILHWIGSGLVLVGVGALLKGAAPSYWGLPAVGAVVHFGTALMVWDHIRRGKIKGYTVKALAALAYKQPRWWSSWWPRALRQKNNLWDRFPRTLKRTHKWLGAAGAWLLLMPFLPKQYLDIIIGWFSPQFQLTGIVIGAVIAMLSPLVGILLGLLISTLRLRREIIAAGGDSGDTFRFLPPPRHSAKFWRQPWVQKFLLPEPELAPVLEKGGAIRTPVGYAEAISAASASLSGPDKSLAVESETVAKEILKAIEAIDGQIENLAATSDPAEVARYKHRLDALGEETQGEPAGTSRMRKMLQQQLELAQSLTDQLEEAQERRSRLVTMLETLWLQVSSLKAQATVANFDSSAISQKVRSIAEDVQRYREASEETVRLLEPEIINVPNVTGKNAGR